MKAFAPILLGLAGLGCMLKLHRDHVAEAEALKEARVDIRSAMNHGLTVIIR